MNTTALCDVVSVDLSAHPDVFYENEIGSKWSPIDLTRAASETELETVFGSSADSVQDSSVSGQEVQLLEPEARSLDLLQDLSTGPTFAIHEEPQHIDSGYVQSDRCDWSQETISSNLFSLGSAFSSASEVSTWEDSLSVNDVRKLKCSICCELFENAYSLEHHAQRLGHRIFTCPIPGCTKSYCRRDSWTRHKKSHEIEFICPVCRKKLLKKVFRRKDHLRTHIRNAHPEYHYPPDSATPAVVSQQSNLEMGCSFPSSRQGSVAPCPYSPSLPSEHLLQSDKNDDRLFDAACNTFLNSSTHLRTPELEGRTYESLAVRDLVAEIRRMQPEDGDLVQGLDEKIGLKLNPTTTTEQLARSLTKLAVDYHEVRKLKTVPLES